MKKNLAKILALVLSVLMMVSMLAACNGTQKPNEDPKKDPANQDQGYTGGDTLVAGYDYFSSKFSPFFATTAYDQDVAGIVSIGLLGTDREGNVVLKGIEGETIPYNGTDYKYTGIADCTITNNDDGTVVYEFKLREDIKFSDGDALTADDVIFSMYVLSDPTYDGSSTFYAQPIVGMEEYRSGMDALSNLLLADGPDKTSEFYTAEQAEYYWNAFEAAGLKFATGILDDIIEAYGADYGVSDHAGAAELWGYTDIATAADFWAAIKANYGYDISSTGIDYEAFNESIVDLINAELGDKANEYAAGVVTGESAANIAGIEKTGDYSLKITMSKFDAVSIYQLAVSVAPLHYYGSVDAYDYANNKFGFTKGDLSGVKAKTTQPLGAGPYKFKSFENGVITFVANENYFKGCPKITNLLFKETAATDKLAGVTSGAFDVTDPNFDTATVDSIKEANGGELIGNKITTNTVDNLGYGYLGINANNVKVGDDKTSEASKNLRKAFATLFAVYRDTAINSYYGDRAAVIQYPISNTSWAAPKPADEGYALAYSKDVDGNPIYTADMAEEAKYEAALQATIGFLKAAGYTWDEASSKFTAAPAGAKMTYEFIIPADGKGDHPNYAILTDAKAALETIGITLEINDPSDSNVLWDTLDAGECEMWSAAWGATVDPDMYQVYYSTNAVGLGGTNSNHYAIADDELDQLIMDARTSADRAYRKATYKSCLEIIMDWGVEIPSYQRQNALIFSTERVKISTLTPDITTFWGWMNDIEKLEMN
ncbi:MAG: ABC transporter substrate-binding protein [Ruminococcaceae bacterium]|nr:ABC transporter substrate-binding protein [Oscillospiraceae bacterium]